MTGLLAGVALLALAGCAGPIPVAAWVAIGAVAGAVSSTVQLDEAAINGYLALKGKQIAPIAAVPPAPPPLPATQVSQ